MEALKSAQVSGNKAYKVGPAPLILNRFSGPYGPMRNMVHFNPLDVV